MLAGAIHCFFDEHGFFWVNRPIITASGAEGAGALFPVSTLDFANLPAQPRRQVDLAGAAQHRGLLPRLDEGLHFRADLPSRELEH